MPATRPRGLCFRNICLYIVASTAAPFIDSVGKGTTGLFDTPLLAFDVVAWNNVKAVIPKRIVAGEADPHAIDNDPQSFITKG